MERKMWDEGEKLPEMLKLGEWVTGMDEPQ